MTLSEAQAAVDAHVARFEVGYFEPLANVACLAEEVGELARELLHSHGPKPKKAEDGGSAAQELGDVLFVVMCLANSLGVSLEDALNGSLAKYNRRDGNRWKARGADGGTPGAG